MTALSILAYILGWLVLGFIGATIGTRVSVIDPNYKVTHNGRMLILLTMCGPTSIVCVLVFMIINYILVGARVKGPVRFANKYVDICKGYNKNE